MSNLHLGLLLIVLAIGLSFVVSYLLNNQQGKWRHFIAYMWTFFALAVCLVVGVLLILNNFDA